MYNIYLDKRLDEGSFGYRRTQLGCWLKIAFSMHSFGGAVT
jgi:hypothetical protein